jgi:hypothetical protein
MLHTALGPAIAAWLEDPGVIAVMLNPDGLIWIDRLGEELADKPLRLRCDIDVIAPGFAANSLESLEEIAIRYVSLYRSHGGGELRYIPALNDSPGHIKALASLLRRHLRGWAPGPRIS